MLETIFSARARVQKIAGKRVTRFLEVADSSLILKLHFTETLQDAIDLFLNGAKNYFD